MNEKLSFEKSVEIADALRFALNNSGRFWVHARERDGLTDERLTVSYQGDAGHWFTLTAVFVFGDEE